MDAILIEPRNENEMRTVKALISKTDIPSFFIGEENKKKLAAIKMVEIASNHPKYDISEDEIINMMQEGEDEVYGKN